MKTTLFKTLTAFLLIAAAATAQVWNGSIDADWYNEVETEFTLTTAEELAGLAQLVNNGTETFENKTITLGNNIELNNTEGWETWDEATTGLNTWTPIGTFTNQFKGTFNGDNHTISGVYISGTSDYQGLFGVLGSGGEIKNIGVEASYIKGKDYVGGLVGNNDGTVSNSYSTGTVSGEYEVGGLVGGNQGIVSNSYSTGTVSGSDYVGGLVGSNRGIVSNSYSTGTISGNSMVGGLVGMNFSNTVSNSYWDTETSGKDIGIGGGIIIGVTGKTTENMKLQTTYEGWDFTNIWEIVNESNFNINNGYPIFKWQLQGKTLLKEAVVEVAAQEYTGSAIEPNVTVTLNSATLTAGTDYSVSYSNNAAVGTATVTIIGKGNYLGNLLKSFTIAPKLVTITGITAEDKEYDGNTVAEILGTETAEIVGLVLGDDVTVVEGTALFDSKEVGTDKTVTFSGFSLSGTDKDNYTLTQPASVTKEITARLLRVVEAEAVSRVYNGEVSVEITGAALKDDEIVGGEDVSLTGHETGTLEDGNAGEDKPVETAMSLTGANAGNYTLIQPVLTVDITPKPVTITGITADDKEYDGNANAEITGTPVLNGKVGNDDVTVNMDNASASFDNEEVGTNKTVTFTGFSLSGADKDNYTLTQPESVTASILGRVIPPITCPEGQELQGDQCVDEITPIFSNRVNPSIPGIGVQTIGNAITLSNVPQNIKVEIYTLQGKRIYASNRENPRILRIGVPKGMYLVKAGNETFKAAVR